MNFGADLGPWRPATGEVVPKFGDFVKPLSPSRLRRKERRAAERERFAAIGAAAVAVDAANVSFVAGKAAAEVAEAEKVVAEANSAEKVANEFVAAANAAEGTAVEMTAGEESDAAKNDASVAKAAVEVATTSSCGKEQLNATTCWNCDQEMTFDHQCDVPPVPVEIRQSLSTPCNSGRQAKLPCWKCDKMFPVESNGYIPEHHCAESPPAHPSKGVRPEPSPPMILKKPVRMLDGSPVLPSRPK